MTETFGHRPALGFIDGRALGNVCERCSTRLPNPPRYFGPTRQAVRWPCTTALILGLADRPAA